MFEIIIAQTTAIEAIWRHIVADFSNSGSPAALAAFGPVLMIDIMLAGDHALVVGPLAAGLPAPPPSKGILIGTLAALDTRVNCALLVPQLLLLAGSLFSRVCFP